MAFTNGADLYRISNANYGPQVYSQQDVDTTAGTCTGLSRGNIIYSNNNVGSTMGGSSGSPVVNSDGKVVGQLSGGCGTNVNDVCDTINNATVDGAFAAYFEQVKPFLDPPECVPVEEICDDLIDNDCDGLIDGDDTEDCDGGGGEPKGEPCVDDSDCASNKCRGKPGAKTCK